MWQSNGQFCFPPRSLGFKVLKIFTGYPAPFCLDATEYVRWSLRPLEGLSILPFYTINLSEALWVAFRPF